MSDTSRPSIADRRQQWLQRVDSALHSSGLQVASELAVQALSDGIEDPVLLNLAAAARHNEGRFEEAIQLLTRANALQPSDPNVLNSLGICQAAAGDIAGALDTYAEAVRRDPSIAAAHYNRGALLEQVDDVNGARAAYQTAASLDSRYAEPLASLAWLDAIAGDAQSARSHAQSALALGSDALAHMALASADLQQGQLEASEARLFALVRDPALSRLNRAIVAGLIGDLRDAQGRPAEAFGAYQACNAELKAVNADRFEAPGQESALARVRRLTAWFAQAPSDAWRSAPPVVEDATAPRQHVFLVGFPRSGTTLLENVLAAHPDVVSLEEKDCLSAAEGAFLGSAEGLNGLSAIGADEAQRYRELYWSAARGFRIDPTGKVFIDKLPLASVSLPVIAKLFPNARVLFALRDPRDVVLSCFRRRFALNPAMYELLTLEGAARFYDATMRLSAVYRDVLPLALHVVRYESLVDNFEETAKAACDFLGLQWDQSLFDFAAKARTRGIATPSAAQVTRGLNRDGQGVWRRYREQMAPVFPLLEPWVEPFGYDPT